MSATPNIDPLKIKGNKLDATQAPGVSDDSSQNYSVGSKWVDVTNDKVYFCTDATVGAATWSEVGSGGGGGGGNTIYTADGTLTGSRTVDLGGNALIFDNGDSTGGVATTFDGRTAFISNRISSEANILEVRDNANNRILEVRENNSVHINAQGTGDVVLGANAQIGSEKISLQGKTYIKGTGTTGNSLLSLYDGQGTPEKLWDFLDNGNVNLGSDSIIDLGATNNLTIENSGASSNFQINADSGGYFLFNRSGGLKVVPSSAGNDSIVCTNVNETAEVFNVEKIGGGYWNANGGVNIGADDGVTDFANFSVQDLNFYANGSLKHKIGYKDPNDDVFFQINGALEGRYFIVGGNTAVANEAIGLHGATLIKGKGTTGSSLLSLYDNQGTPVKLWDFLDNGDIIKNTTSTNTPFIEKSTGTTYNINNLSAVTQAEYNALTPDADTIYFIV
jgi:hypothetical protein